MITVSVCMIVKDEEKILRRCLNSLKGLADEIIIVDTGSRDATKQIAAEFTDKIYDFEWKMDFSAARNYSFTKATMEYIYTADADEVIDEENRQRFLLLKQKLLPEIEIVQMKYGNQLSYNTTYNFNEEYRPKLYRRLRSFRWIDPLHERVSLAPLVYDSDIVITHMPVISHAKRDFRNFQETIRQTGQLSIKLYEMYAKELYIAGEDEDFNEAFVYFRTFADRDECSDREGKIYECILVRCLRQQGDSIGMMKYALRNLADGKGSSEVCYELGEYYMNMGDYMEAILWYYNAAYEAEYELNIHYGGDYPLKCLAQCYQSLGDLQQEEAFMTLYNNWSMNNKE